MFSVVSNLQSCLFFFSFALKFYLFWFSDFNSKYRLSVFLPRQLFFQFYMQPPPNPVKLFLSFLSAKRLGKQHFGKNLPTTEVLSSVTPVSACSVAQSCPTLCEPMTVAHQAPPSMDSPSKNTGVGCHFLQGFFPAQGSNPSPMSPALAGRFFTTE